VRFVRFGRSAESFSSLKPLLCVFWIPRNGPRIDPERLGSRTSGLVRSLCPRQTGGVDSLLSAPDRIPDRPRTSGPPDIRAYPDPCPEWTEASLGPSVHPGQGPGQEPGFRGPGIRPLSRVSPGGRRHGHPGLTPDRGPDVRGPGHPGLKSGCPGCPEAHNGQFL
jgi:hypothetical protein